MRSLLSILKMAALGLITLPLLAQDPPKGDAAKACQCQDAKCDNRQKTHDSLLAAEL